MDLCYEYTAIEIDACQTTWKFTDDNVYGVLNTSKCEFYLDISSKTVQFLIPVNFIGKKRRHVNEEILAQSCPDFTKWLLVDKGFAMTLNQISMSNVKVISDLCA